MADLHCLKFGDYLLNESMRVEDYPFFQDGKTNVIKVELKSSLEISFSSEEADRVCASRSLDQNQGLMLAAPSKAQISALEKRIDPLVAKKEDLVLQPVFPLKYQAPPAKPPNAIVTVPLISGMQVEAPPPSYSKPLQVEIRPQGKVRTLIPTITVQFSSPMVPLTSLSELDKGTSFAQVFRVGD